MRRVGVALVQLGDVGVATAARCPPHDFVIRKSLVTTAPAATISWPHKPLQVVLISRWSSPREDRVRQHSPYERRTDLLVAQAGLCCAIDVPRVTLLVAALPMHPPRR